MLSEIDQRVLENLKEAGSDISKPHEIRHYLYFLTLDSAEKASLILKKNGFDTEISSGADHVSFLVLATNYVIPDPDFLAETIGQVSEVANNIGGEYDGWEAGIVK